VLPALAFPLVLAPGGRPLAGPGDPSLWGAVVVLGLAAVRVNLLVTVAAGVAVVAFLRALGG
ncbi:MAG TPA: AzlD domain-containing protein, partial [Methylomirabilota bacterium]|nr:AzlD domain-containing protein [Methylomirabilota bacterium]